MKKIELTEINNDNIVDFVNTLDEGEAIVTNVKIASEIQPSDNFKFVINHTIEFDKPYLFGYLNEHECWANPMMRMNDLVIYAVNNDDIKTALITFEDFIKDNDIDLFDCNSIDDVLKLVFEKTNIKITIPEGYATDLNKYGLDEKILGRKILEAAHSEYVWQNFNKLLI